MDTIALDQAIDQLQRHKDEWAFLPLGRKSDLLLQLRSNLRCGAKRWAALTSQANGLDPTSPWVGEAWIGGPWAFGAGINGLLHSLEALVAGQIPRPRKVWTRPNGQVVAQVFPADAYDRLLFSDVTMEVWMQPGVTLENLARHTAVFYQQDEPAGQVALVLGAGNVSSIPALDIIHMLYAQGRVVILKMNPVNEYIGPVLEEIFDPFISAGYLRIVYGGPEVGQYLVNHPGVESIHVTGSARTYETIVFGPGEEGRRRKMKGEPLLQKPITSELGGVGPVIVVPGPWQEADIRYQAENIVTMKLQNSGYNCVSIQVLLLPERWEHSQALLEAIRQLMRELPPRKPYYPGTAERQQSAVAHHPEAQQMVGDVPRTLICGLDPEAESEWCFGEEIFGETLAQVSLPGDTPSAFLQNAVAFCNERLQGTLGANIIIHPKTAKKMSRMLDAAVDRLRYGAVGVNIWAAGAFLLAQAAWGGYPGATQADIQSGSGFVHNSFMFDKPQKSVVRGSFCAIPRAWRHGDFHISPKPAWFVTNKTAAVTTRRVTWLVTDPSPKYLPGIFISALKG